MSEQAYSFLADLEALSKKSASALPAAKEIQAIWSGVAFRIGDNKFVAPISEVAEVIPVPNYTIVPGVKSWVRGIANVRGRLLPVMDLGSFLQAAKSEKEPSQRILVVDKNEMYSGLVVDEVMGMQHFQADSYTDRFESCGETVDPFVDGAYKRDGEDWHLFNLFHLADDPHFLQAAV